MMVETTATDANDTAGTITQVVFLDQLGTEPCDYPMATARAPIKILFLTKSLHFEPIVELDFQGEVGSVFYVSPILSQKKTMIFDQYLERNSRRSGYLSCSILESISAKRLRISFALTIG
jgi:hypothetical protein